MAKREYKTPEDVFLRGCEAKGIPFKHIDKKHRLSGNKGSIGQMMEESWFEYPINNDARPDFPEAGVELKVTPYIRTRNGVSAKERLVCNIIDYMEEYKKTFLTSSFYTKCNTMLIMIYEHLKGVDKGDYSVDKVSLFRFPDEDLKIIEQDWEKIVSAIKDGRAHEISEGDTFYLGACTKGSPKKGSGDLVLRKQPFAPIDARQRAFSLKQSYMTVLLREYIFGEKVDEKILKDSDIDALSHVTFEEYVKNKFDVFLGKSRAELKKSLHIETTAKSQNSLLVSAVLGVKNAQNTEEFQKANVKIKTICVEANGTIRENMSFPGFSFSEIIEQDWEDSREYELLVMQKYLFVIFQKDGAYSDDAVDSDDHLFLKAVSFWQLPREDVEEVERVWKKTVEVIKRGPMLIPSYDKNGKMRIKNDLPKESESTVAHIRPHTSQAAYRFDGISIGELKDADELPDGRWMTKQCFWFNHKFVENQIKGLIGQE